MFRLSLVVFLLCLAAPAAGQNRLKDANSPYLLQHADNPVDWYPWGPEALEKARSENRLILVSVGYASCHWCHVMREESFEDEVIAAFLNEHFVAIKIDRERRPDLDEQFMLATQTLTGSGGWPNNVFLTPQGDPFFGGTYIPPDTFKSVLLQLVALWQQDPEALVAEGERVSAALSNYLTRKSEAAELTPERIHAAASAVLDELDPFAGGLGETAKFPRETLFLFLLDEAERSGDDALLSGVTDMLDGMVRGGIHDHVGGGFHRYTVDPNWQVPHFEKMLYNQALTGRLLVRAWRITGEAAYRRAAERTFDYVLRELRAPGGGFYASQDADSAGADGRKDEGLFYLWTAAQLAEAAPDGAQLAELFQVSADGGLEGGILVMADDPPVLAELTGRDEAAFYDWLDPRLEALRAARAQRPAPATDEKVLMGWNGAMIATLAEAATTLERPDYLEAASQAARFVLENLKAEDGYARAWFAGRSTTPAQLDDYAAFGLGLVALHDHAGSVAERAAWLAHARAMADAIETHFGAPDDGFRMNAAPEGFSAIIPIEDREMPAGNALALRLFAALANRMAAPELERSATRLAAALGGLALEDAVQRAGLLQGAQVLRLGETGPIRYAAAGAVRVQMQPGAETVRFNIDIAPGWHINAHEPLEDYFIPTGLRIGARVVPADAFPAPLVKPLGFNPEPLALYERSLTLEAGVMEGENAATLTLQACSDEICLEPEELRFTLW